MCAHLRTVDPRSDCAVPGAPVAGQSGERRDGPMPMSNVSSTHVTRLYILFEHDKA